MHVPRILTAVAVGLALMASQRAQADEPPRGPTDPQKMLCRQNIDEVRDSEQCTPEGDDTEIVDGCSKGGQCQPCVELLQCLESVSDNPDPTLFGAWEQVVPESSSPAIHGSLGMATIHGVLLPSGKVLLASGSGWRNPFDSEVHPEEAYPESARGLFFRHEKKCERDLMDPFLEKNKEMYQRLVNNVAVYDPSKNTFFRIPHPPQQEVEWCDPAKGTPSCVQPSPQRACADDEETEKPEKIKRFHANDLFCSGHLHLRDGNPLFMGGTQYYAPLITGARTSYIFDWKKEHETNWIDFDWRDPAPKESPWIFSGLMKRGRWYPTPVPLLDGRLVILSGLRGFDEVAEGDAPYLFEVNHLVEIFDPNAFNAQNPEEAWTSIDVKDFDNSPFRQKLHEPVDYGTCLDADDLSKQNVHSRPCQPEGDPEKRAAHDLEFDTFKLYPNVYNFGRRPQGVEGRVEGGAKGGDRLFFTREGDFISMRSPDMATMRDVKQTYWMEVLGNRGAPEVRFELGEPRTASVPSYGASFVDPNNGSIRVLGGGENSPGTLFPLTPDWNKRTRFLGARGSRNLETYVPGDDPQKGHWTRKDDFLGEFPQDDRILSNAILLPTKQVLIINGGNYQLQKPVYHPLLLTPEQRDGQFDAYKTERMAEAVQPRQYHAVALLLPDGRIWTSGGNAAPARINTDEAAWKAWESKKMPRGAQPEHDPDLVDLDIEFFREGRYGRHEKGSMALPAENWTAEIFSPPYLFIDGDRRAEITGIESNHESDSAIEFTVPGADRDAKVYLLKSNRTYKTTIANPPILNGQHDRSGHYRLIKLPSATHGSDFGQRLYELNSLADGTGFRTPQASEANIPPGYYMLFFVDAKGKPAEAKMVRFDDSASAP